MTIKFPRLSASLLPGFLAAVVGCSQPQSPDDAAASAATNDTEPTTSVSTGTPPTDSRWVWDLTSLYADLAAWDDARQAVREQAKAVATMEGTLATGPEALLTVVEAIHALTKDAARVFTYASLDADVDLRESAGQERRQLAQQMYTDATASFSWFAPELIALGADTLDAYLAAEPRLATYQHVFDDTLRQSPHIRSAEVEAVLAAAGLMQSAPFNVYGTLANSDIPFPTLTLTSGEDVLINSQGYSRHRSAQDRDTRRQVFEAYWGTWEKYKSTVGQSLSAHIQAQVFSTRQRNHDSSLARNLFSDALPPAVYQTLINVTNDNLDTLHRYLRLKGRVLALEDLNYHDIYVDLVEPVREYSIEDAITMTHAAMAPLGEDYQNRLKAATDQRWMHVYPQQGKRSGAYMAGSAYDVHPFILLNHNDDFNSVSTYAHEWGHGIHQVLSNEFQPWHLSDFSIFTTEVAAIANELLVQDYALRQAQTDEERLFYLGYALEAIRTTFFRQTMFSEFEGEIYGAVENGEALSGQRITDIYAEIVRRYHGHDEGVMDVPDLYTHEWMFVPHFYFNYYVFQYSTSIAAAAYFVEEISRTNESTTARETYLRFLQAGGSDYPYALFQQAGLDMAQPEPYLALIRRMNDLMDDFEETLSKVEAQR
ncbi:MAG: oligoendopeptidase F [Oceanococcaceae bacterium]